MSMNGLKKNILAPQSDFTKRKAEHGSLKSSVDDLQEELRLMDGSETEEEKALRKYQDEIKENRDNEIEFTAVSKVLPPGVLQERNKEGTATGTDTITEVGNSLKSKEATLVKESKSQVKINIPSLPKKSEVTRTIKSVMAPEITLALETNTDTSDEVEIIKTEVRKLSDISEAATANSGQENKSSEIALLKLKAEIMVDVISEAKLLEYKVLYQLSKIKTNNVDLIKCMNKIKILLEEYVQKKKIF